MYAVDKQIFMQSYKRHFTSLLHLGVPIIIAQLGTIVQSFADTIMVGQYGTPELSAAGFTNNIFNLVILLLLGFSYSTTPIVGSFHGRGMNKDVGRSLKESLVANVSVCLVVMLVMAILYFNLDLLGQPDELMPLIRSYYIVVFSSLIFISLFNSMKQFCDAVGDTKVAMWVMIIGNVVNVIGNSLLIFGLFGFPEMGLLGAGLATLLSRIIMAVSMILVIAKTKRYAPYREGFKQSFTKEGVIHISKVGFPISLQMGLEASSFNICAIFMGWIGAASLAAHQVMCTVGSLCFMIYYGIGAAAAIRISHFCGLNEWGEVRRTAFVSLAMTLCFGVIMSCLIIVFRYQLAYAFTTSEEVVMLVMTLVPPMVAYQFGDSIQTVFANCLRATEDVKVMMIDAFIAYGIVSIPLSYVFAFVLDWGTSGIWWGFPFGLTTAGLLFFYRFNKQTKKRISKQ